MSIGTMLYQWKMCRLCIGNNDNNIENAEYSRVRKFLFFLVKISFLWYRNSIDDRLRIALGVIAGLLGTSVIILLGAFCWLRRRQKMCRLSAEKSLESSSSSSLYISPVHQQGKYTSSVSPIYQLSYNNFNKTNTFYRADSFRQAVGLGQQDKKFTEHVSTKRDSFVQEKDGWSSPTFSTLEYVVPTINNENTNNNNNNQRSNCSSPSILTYAV